MKRIIKITEEGEYSLSVALLEDGIVADQTGGTTNYVHNNVFLGFLQENPDGDPLGTLQAGKTVERIFKVKDTDGDLHIAAFVSCEGIVNSATDARMEAID